MRKNDIDKQKALEKADEILRVMTLEEKITLIGGVRGFFIPAIPRLGLNEIFMSDASCGVNIRETWLEDRVDTDLEKSVAFPCLLQLASTWNRDLCEKYARSIGEECRAGGIHILLGPGMNIYRHSQSGRNFEYLGEDPFLVSELIERYVTGLQETGVAATLKHFIANNSDFYRRKSNSIVGRRALHEIYLPAFKRGVETGAKAVMTAYNLLNGEWCSQNRELISEVLRKELGFSWLVMTDWWAINDCGKAVKSGLDLEMPASEVFQNIPALLETGEIRESDLDRMVYNILKTSFAMDFYNDGFKDKAFIDNYDEHESIAFQTACEGIVLLKNREGLLPYDDEGEILLTGLFSKETARGGGASEVEGFNHLSLADALEARFGSRVRYVDNPSDDEIRNASSVLLSTGTLDSEGWDRPFALPDKEEQRIRRIVGLNERTVVLVNSGGGIRMTDWADEAGAILYGWYGGQMGSRAVTAVLSGDVNPSGKLPITIEKEFSHSPGADYLPEGEELYHGWDSEGEEAHPVYDLSYEEGIMVGYRWYENKQIEPLFPFGFGLSYTDFEYEELKLTREIGNGSNVLTAEVRLFNRGVREGQEIVQLYVGDTLSTVLRPVKELKGFEKVSLKPGEGKTVSFTLSRSAFSYWSEENEKWTMEPGDFTIFAGSSSRPQLEAVITLD